MVLNNLGIMVLPLQQAVSRAGSAFDGSALKDDKMQSQVVRLGVELVATLNKLG